MKFMMLMIPRIYQPSTPESERAGEGFAPNREEMEAMGRFNDELEKAGLLLDCNGFHPITKGARVSFADGKATVIDGSAIQTPEVVGGYWLVEAGSKEELIEWMKRCPAMNGDVIEIRPIFCLPEEG